MSKEVLILHGAIETPPMSHEARVETGNFLRRLQEGESLAMPHSRPMGNIGARVHELRINDQHATWRIIYRIDADAIIIAEVFSKKTQQTPLIIIRTCQRRYRDHDNK